ncbi:hypothetical protein SAMN05660477_01338 [Soonwooa buanensis]|uniref:Lipoprotein n=1 Tax=Soonwooa buanensis TaxID=619805 RepID=A0A1T5EES9_9FLAO|nr:hypothetical protein [Soonwooa buanensis]SKB82250.1 hypothetical protein SAMN05660477_01338 [Soonwooa buanensis]
MKKIFPILVMVCLLLSACRTTKYKQEWGNNFLEVKAGSKYHFKTFSNGEFKMAVTSVEKDSIFGIRHKENVGIAKKDIRIIKKDSPVGTAALLVGIAGSGTLIYLLAKATTNFGHGFGHEYED